MALLPMPAFFLGQQIPRPGSILLYLGFALVSGLAGFGLLRLDNRARLLTYAYMVVGLANFLVLVTPGGQARYARYNDLVFASPHGGSAPVMALNIHALRIFMLGVFIAFYGVQIWILEHYRRAFTRQPAPPPDPLDSPLTL